MILTKIFKNKKKIKKTRSKPNSKKNWINSKFGKTLETEDKKSYLSRQESKMIRKTQGNSRRLISSINYLRKKMFRLE